MTAKLIVNGVTFDSEGEAVLSLQLAERGIQAIPQFRFDLNRKWRFDFAVKAGRLGIEIEGGTWVNGGHNRGTGYENNCRKYNSAIKHGWRVLRFTTDMVMSLEAIETIQEVLTKIEV